MRPSWQTGITLEQIEGIWFLGALKHHDNRLSSVARDLGVSRAQVYRLVKRHTGMSILEFRQKESGRERGKGPISGLGSKPHPPSL